MLSAKHLFTFVLCLALALSAPAFGQEIYVNGAVGASGDGTSWATAYKTIGEGLLDVNAGTRDIRVAGGTYNETSLTLVTGAEVYGAYTAGTTTRNVAGTPTIIDGGHVGNRVISGVSVTGIRLDGLTITNGLYDPAGGARFIDASGTVENCTFTNCTSPSNGGAMRLDGVSNFTISNSTFSGNTSESGGAAIRYDNEYMPTVSSALAITDCTFENNRTKGGGSYNGGAVALRSSHLFNEYDAYSETVTITDCTFSGNLSYDDNTTHTTSGGGGGLASRAVGTVNVTGCTFENNVATGGGGGICAEVGNLTVTDCVLTGNTVEGLFASTANWSAKSTGGGAIMWGGGSEMNSMYGGGLTKTFTLTASKCTITDNVLTGGGVGAGIGVYGTSGGGAMIANITNCVIAGNTTAVVPFSEVGNLNGGNPGIGQVKPGGVDCTFNITNCTLKNNVDQSPISIPNAGAIWTAQTATNVTNCIITGTQSDLDVGTAIQTVGAAPTVTNCLFFGNEANGTEGTAPQTTDPLYVGASARPAYGSPAIDNGTASGAPGDDILGQTRPNGSYDIGAYEWYHFLIAKAGDDAAAGTGLPYHLTGSSETDGFASGAITYTWSVESKPLGSNVSFSPNATTQSPNATFDTVGTYVLKLTVADSTATASDTVTIDVTEFDAAAQPGSWMILE
ncbi:hypothetical protein JW916_09230 [Candidatus Sumerlaeota bacterium]|nr:hypothetical protein [Candidatus Sumerlaeota bacterium]